MANTIKLKRGTSTPTTSNIVDGEVALDTSAKKLYVNDGGTVKEIGGGGVTSDAQGNITIGVSAGDDFSGTDAENNILIGENAGTAIDTADRNIAIGTDTIKINTGQGDNVAVGHEALKNVTRFPTSGGAFSFYGQRNVAIGSQALAGGTAMTGYNNVAIGYQALKSNTEGYTCVAVGSNALENNIARGNTACGTSALKSLNSNFSIYNTAIGEVAGRETTTGNRNLYAGWAAGLNITSGTNNTVLGYKAAHSGTNDLTTGSNNINIGKEAAASSATVSNEITLGDGNITKFRVPGLNFVVKDSTATEGHVLTVDSNGECGFAEASGGGPTGGGSDKVFIENGQTVTTNYTIGDTFGAACNAMAAGPITINSSVTVTVNSGDTLTIV